MLSYPWDTLFRDPEECDCEWCFHSEHNWTVSHAVLPQKAIDEMPLPRLISKQKLAGSAKQLEIVPSFPLPRKAFWHIQICISATHLPYARSGHVPQTDRLFSYKCCCLFSAFEIPPDKFSDCSKQENSCFFSDSDDLFMNFQKYILYFFWKSAIMIADSMRFCLKFLQINGRILRRNLHFIEIK